MHLMHVLSSIRNIEIPIEMHKKSENILLPHMEPFQTNSDKQEQRPSTQPALSSMHVETLSIQFSSIRVPSKYIKEQSLQTQIIVKI